MSSIRPILIIAVVNALILAGSVPFALGFVWLARGPMTHLATVLFVGWLVGAAWAWFKLYDWIDRHV